MCVRFAEMTEKQQSSRALAASGSENTRVWRPTYTSAMCASGKEHAAVSTCFFPGTHQYNEPKSGGTSKVPPTPPGEVEEADEEEASPVANVVLLVSALLESDDEDDDEDDDDKASLDEGEAGDRMAADAAMPVPVPRAGKEIDGARACWLDELAPVAG